MTEQHDDRIAPLAPVDARAVTTWHDDADVVVVGLGIAGTCAALAAADAGADVVALERAMVPGGTSAMSGGLIYLGGGTPVQQACGFEDSPANMAAFLTAACGPGVDVDKVEAYCEGSVGHFGWLVDHGVPFKGEFFHEPNREPRTDAGLVYSGGEDSWPFNELAVPAPRGHHPRFPDTAGGYLMSQLGDTLAAGSSRVRCDSAFERLIVDDGEVVGVMADGLAIRARGGVVMAAGGFAFNEAMAAHYCPDVLRPDPAWRIGQPNDDGRAIRAAQGAGAALIRMDAFECALPLGPPHRLARALLIGRDGRRFINEDTYTGRIGQAALVHRRGDVYMIVSEEIYEPNLVGLRISWAAETAAELAEDIGVPPDALTATVDDYNAAAERGVDPQFHKTEPFVVPLRPPLGAIDLRVDAGAIYATFTLGGVGTDPDARVLDGRGSPIPGLFAAGRTTAGIAAGGYVSGISLGDGSFFGRRAGEVAASSAR